MAAPLTLASRADIARELIAKTGLRGHIRVFWPTIDPAPLKYNWHLDAIAEHLTAVQTRQIKRLAITVWPGSAKSSVTSALWPSFVWGTDPSHKWMFASADIALVYRDSTRMCNIVRSPLYREVYPEGAVLPDTTNLQVFETTKQGRRFNTSVQGKGVGWHANTQVGDDILKPTDATPTGIKKAIDWWQGTMSSRRADPVEEFARVLVMQRICVGDPADHVLTEEGYEHLCLPFEWSPNPVWDLGSSIGGAAKFDPRTVEGEIGDKQRYTPETAAKMILEYGTNAPAQLNQNTMGAASQRVQAEWFRRYDKLPDWRFMRKYQIWDFNSKGQQTAQHSRVSGLLVGVFQDNIYWVDEIVGWWDWVTGTAEFWERQEQGHPWANAELLIEDKANGTPLLNELSVSHLSHATTAVEPTPGMSKEKRFDIQTPKIKLGRVYLPHVHPRVGEWLKEIQRFPAAPNDRGDTLEIALRKLVSLGTAPDYGAAIKALHEKALRRRGFRR